MIKSTLLITLITLVVTQSLAELSPKRQWWQKIDYDAFSLYRSCDLIGDGQILAVEERFPNNGSLGDLKLHVLFTNMLKGEPGEYAIILPATLRGNRSFVDLPDSVPAKVEQIPFPLGGVRLTIVVTGVVESIPESMLPYTISSSIYPPIQQIIDTNGLYCGEVGQSYAMACEGRGEYIELHAILPPEIWAIFPEQVAEGKRKHEEWEEAKRARQHEIQLIQLKLQDALELGDITQDEYDRQSAELEPLREEDRNIHIELWNDRAGYKYYNETFLEPME